MRDKKRHAWGVVVKLSWIFQLIKGKVYLTPNTLNSRGDESAKETFYGLKLWKIIYIQYNPKTIHSIKFTFFCELSFK